MIKYNNTNNASTTLTAGLSASATTLLVENGDILPTAPFLLTLEHFDSEKVTVREIVKCIAKVSNVLTIQRGAGTCIQDDTATPKAQNNTPHSFSVGDCASIYWTAEQVKDIQDAIDTKLNVTDFQAGTYVYGATSTGTDAYAITIPGTITSYAVGQVFKFMADVENDGPATLNVNGLGALEIFKNHDLHLESGDIEAGQIVEVAYDGTAFQMNSAVATVVDVASLGNTQYKTGVAGEDLVVGDVCCLVDFENDYFEMKLFGATESSVDYEVIGNGESSNSITLWLGRRGNSSGEDLVVELIDTVDDVETVIASSQIARSGLTEDTTVETVCSWGEDIETEKGKSYTLRLRTYDNSVDADKGFYYNKTEGENASGWSNTTYKCGLKTEFSQGSSSTPTDQYPLIVGTYFNIAKDSRSKSGTNTITLYGNNNTIQLQSSWGTSGTARLIVNGTTISSYSRSSDRDFYFLGDRLITPTNNSYLLPEDNYETWDFNAYSAFTSDLYGTMSYSYAYVPPQNIIKLNFKDGCLCDRVFYKGNCGYLFVNSKNVLKGEETIFETGGTSNILTSKSVLRYGATILGCNDYDGKLKYKTRFYLPYVVNIFLYKDAVMLVKGNLNGKGISQDGKTYISGFPDLTNYIANFLLEGGHNYKITFNESDRTEFYLVD